MNARQKMINMMYLVLTAILALNVASEVLNAFVVINMGLLQQNESLEHKNQTVLTEFSNQRTIDPGNERIKFLNEQALYIKGISDELTKDIQNMKVQMVMKVDKVDESKALDLVVHPMKVDRKDDYDGPTHFFGTSDPPGTTGKAHDLKIKLSDFHSKCLVVVDKVIEKYPNKNEIRLDLVNKLNIIAPVDPKDNKEFPTWEMEYFYHLPLAAALTELTKWQNFVKGAEGDMLNFLWADISRHVFKFDEVKVAVIPKSNFVTSGSNFEADVFLAAFSTNGSNLPTIVYGSSVDTTTMNVNGGVTLEKDKFVNGVGKVSFPVTGMGEKTFAGTLQMKDPSGNIKTLPFSTTYNVAPPSATVSPDKMNVFYYGLQNPVSISVPGVAPTSIIATGTGCTLTGSNGKYNATPTQQNGKAYINVSARMQDGTTKSMGRYEFRIKTVPTPKVKWGRIEVGSKVSANEATQPLIPYMENFEFDISITIKSFDLFVKQNNGSTIIKNNLPGNQIPQNLHTQMRALQKGTKVMFDNVKMAVPGGTRTTSVVWEIK